MIHAAAMAEALRHALDPVAFAEDRLAFIPDAWQARLLRSTAHQVLLCCSRQSGKSTTTAVLALHVCMFKPGALVLVFSKALRQSQELLLKVKGFLGAMPDAPALMAETQTSINFANDARLISLPGDGDSVRGFSAPDLVVEDEAAFVTDSLNTAIRPMLAVSNGRLILMSTPNGKRGHFYKAWSDESADWHRESVTAEECPRISKEFLAREMAALGPWIYRQEYCCEFTEASGQMYSEEAISAMLDGNLKELEIPL
jgi:hypothetical protein